MNLMMCHKANNLPKGAPSSEMPICQGWIRVMGFDAIGVRIAAMHGRITIEEVEDKTSIELFPSFEEMLRANKIPLAPRNRRIDLIEILRHHNNTMQNKQPPQARPIDITKGSRWKNRRTKRVAEIVIGFRPEPISTYMLESRRATRDDGDDAYEELARDERAKKQQIMYRYVKKTGRHIATCNTTAEKFLAAFTPT